jgi:large subunit ribosomal protein L32
MPNTNRRHSQHRKRIRRSHHALAVVLPNHCPRCGAATRPHRVCDNCGHYGFDKNGQKGSEIVAKDEF